jgi:uncharacterized protein
MAGSSLLLLIDDIATLLDDVAVLSKVTAKKTAGVLGDDLALNAQQVTGVNADRELPVVWAVAKGSFLNKLILVPAALAISAFAPILITPLLMIGGLFLCYEGVETLIHKWFHKSEEVERRTHLLAAITDSNIDILAFEQKKIKGAIRTDFVLSAEIIAISLGVVANSDLLTQAVVLATVAILITVFVYGLVAGIVRLDDWGLYLTQKTGESFFVQLQHRIGTGLLNAVPYLMRGLSIVGTAAMFLVGGGIISHSIPALHHIREFFVLLAAEIYPVLGSISSLLLDGVTGIISGLLVFFMINVVIKKVKIIGHKSY